MIDLHGITIIITQLMMYSNSIIVGLCKSLKWDPSMISKKNNVITEVIINIIHLR